MKKFIFYFACLSLLAAACRAKSDAPAPGPAVAAPESAPAGLHFRLNNAKIVYGVVEDGNWCAGDYSQTIVINPDRNDYNRRYFYLGDGVYKVIVNGSLGTSSFMLRRTGAEEVEVSTGTQYPCLSSPKNFLLSGNTDHWDYDNQGGIKYSVNVKPYENWLRLEIVFPPDSGYGLVVDRCSNCQ